MKKYSTASILDVDLNKIYKKVAEKHNITPEQAKIAYEVFFKSLVESIKKSDKSVISIPGFMRFYLNNGFKKSHLAKMKEYRDRKEKEQGDEHVSQ